MDPAGEVELQRKYYQETAKHYESMHVSDRDEHAFALAFLLGNLDYLGVASVLDVGSGTGRVISYLKQHRPGLQVLGVEPVQALREVGYGRGLTRAELVEGDATKLPFADNSFDLVCECGVLHHIKHPAQAVSEMLRVARKAIFISDSNNYGQGSPVARTIKQILRAVRLWRLADLIKTRGKGYIMSEGDGLAYSYSVFDNYELIRSRCSSVHVTNISGCGINPYRTAAHAALLGVK